MRLRSTLSIVLIVGMATFVEAANASAIRMYIVRSSGFVDEAADGANDLTKLFKRAEDPKATKELIVLVDSPGDADITVEVLSREEVGDGRLLNDDDR
jgi:hypothetical protein